MNYCNQRYSPTLLKLGRCAAILLLLMCMSFVAHAEEQPENPPPENPTPENPQPENPPADNAGSPADQAADQRSFSFSGEALSRSTMDLEADDEWEDFFTNRDLVYGKGLFRFSDRFSVTLSGIGEYLLRLNSKGYENGAEYSVGLEEFYADLHFGKFDLRLGQQIVTWGRMDVFAPTDTINSVDYTKMIDTELGHYKIPNLMAKADYYWTNFNAEAIFIPFFRPARLDFIGGDWTPLGNHVPVDLVTDSLNDSYLGRDFLNYLNQHYPGWDGALEDALSSERLNALGPTTPADDLQHWELAVKGTLNYGPVSSSASYFYAWSDLPILTFSPAARDLFQALLNEETPPELIGKVLELDPTDIYESAYRRINQFGLDFEANLGPSVLKAEGTYVPAQATYNDQLEVVERPMLTYTASADYVLPFDINFALFFLQAYTPHWTKDLLMARSYSFLGSYMEGKFLEDKLEFYLQMLYDTTYWSADGWRQGDIFNQDFQFSGKVSYEVLTDFYVGLGTILFGGPEDQLIGILRSRSFGFLDLEYKF